MAACNASSALAFGSAKKTWGAIAAITISGVDEARGGMCYSPSNAMAARRSSIYFLPHFGNKGTFVIHPFQQPTEVIKKFPSMLYFMSYIQPLL